MHRFIYFTVVNILMAGNNANVNSSGKADNKVVTAYGKVEAAFSALDRGEGSISDAEKYFQEFKGMVNSVKLTPKSLENANRVMSDFESRLNTYQEAEKIRESVKDVGNSLRKYLDSTEVDKRHAVELLGAYQEAVDAYREITDLPEDVKKRREADIENFHDDIIDLEDRTLKLPDVKPHPKIEAPVEVPKSVEISKPMPDYKLNDPFWRDMKAIEDWLDRNPIKNKNA